MTTAGIDLSLLEAAIGKMPADALTELRRDALTSFGQQGFPTTRHEDWKYTNLGDAVDIANEWLDAVAAGRQALVSEDDGEPDIEAVGAIPADWIIIGDGIIQGELPAIDGVTLTRLTADQGNLTTDDVPMSAFNLALLRDGLRIAVAPDAALPRPIGLLYLDAPSNTVTQSRVVIDAAPGSQLAIIEYAVSAAGGRQFTNSVLDVNLADGARLSALRLQNRHDEHTGVYRLDARLAKDAALHHSNFDFGGALTRNDVVTEIKGAGASVTLDGLYLASGEQHIDNHTSITHGTGPSVSREEYRGILTGSSRCVFNGRVVVAEGADGTDSAQSNHNLLLSERAEIDTKPELEIYADDVKCAHGATVGQLDEAAIFYLRSRGLDPEDARQLLTRAFAAGTLGNIAVDETREFLTTALERRLEALVGDLE